VSEPLTSLAYLLTCSLAHLLTSLAHLLTCSLAHSHSLTAHGFLNTGFTSVKVGKFEPDEEGGQQSFLITWEQAVMTGFHVRVF
jgi:hypothetical protein